MNPGGGHCLMDSLTGAVSSQRVTEEFKGTLRAVGYRPLSVKVEGCLTARPMRRADWKQGLSDPVDPCGRSRGSVSRKAKLRTQAPVNGGRNYDGPKVAKYLGW